MTAPVPTPVLATRHLTVAVPDQTLCEDLTLEVRAGESWAVLGPNGAGKTSLLLTLAGLRPPRHGEVRVHDVPVGGLGRRRLARTVGLLTQDNAEGFPATVLETALIGRHPHINGWWRSEAEADYAAARAALRTVELDHLADRLTTTLSGGERRRAAVATVLAQDPELFLLDEPTNHLDLRHQIALLAHMSREARQRGKAVVMALHDINLARRFCDRVLVLYGGGETEQGPVEALLDPPHLERLYGYPFAAVEGPAGIAYIPR